MASRRVEEAERERVWAIAAAHSAGLSIRKIAAATSLSSSRVHQLLHTDEAGEIPDWLSQLAKPEVGADERPVGKQTLPPILLASCIDADWQNWSPSCHRSVSASNELSYGKRWDYRRRMTRDSELWTVLSPITAWKGILMRCFL
ncbi:MAG: hypothetical protein GY906_15635 [bacterium]|nr:hypothetical protein [bacterium]